MRQRAFNSEPVSCYTSRRQTLYFDWDLSNRLIAIETIITHDVKNMDKEYMEDLHFQGEDFSERRLEKGEYDHCWFSVCNFYNANLSGILFS